MFEVGDGGEEAARWEGGGERKGAGDIVQLVRER
jgi:hypothetical protein